MNNLTSACRSFWTCLTSVGIDGVSDPKEEKYIRFSNVIAVLTALAVVAYIPFSLIQGYYVLGMLQTVDVVFVLTVLWLNHLHYHTVSRHAYILVINSFVLINSCFIGFEGKVQDFFYISYIVPFLLFSVKDYRNITAGVLTAIVFFNIYEHIYPYFTRYNLDPASQHTIYAINLWMKFALFGIAIYILSYYNYSTERELAATNDKLKDQAEKLKRSNEDLEQYAAIISHDLKAPLRNISSFMTLLKRKHAADMVPDAVSFIDLSKSSADRMARQIEDLLDYSKLGKNLSSAGAVDVGATVRTICIELGEKIKEKNAAVLVDGDMPVLRNMHSSMLHHIFQNLIANGIKFNTDIRPEVIVRCSPVADRYLFEVRDNGIGIDQAYKDKLFQMFKRLHTEEEFDGTGIGLAVCKKIVNFYGGNIWFESQPGQGTSFFFTLPRPKEDTAQLYTVKFQSVAHSHAVHIS